MNNTIHSPTFSPSARLFVAGLVALTLLAGRLQGQYVSTSISTGLYEPYGVAVDPIGNVYVSDAVNNRIVEFVPSTTNLTTFVGKDGPAYAGSSNGTNTTARFSQPQGIVYAPNRGGGGLVVVDQNNQQLRFVTLAGVVTDLAGVTGQPGWVDGTNLSPNMGGVQFSFPTAIAVANDGATLYIADQGNGALRELSSSNVVSTVVTSFQYNSVNTPFNSLSAVAVDANNNVWVADSYYQVICVLSNGVGPAQVVAGTPMVMGADDSSAPTGAQFNQPSGLLWDTNNNLLVISDTGNSTIRTLFWTNYQGESSYYVQTVAGVAGTAGFMNGAPGVAEFNQPTGLSLDAYASGYYVVDTANNALRVLQPTQPPPPPQPIANPIIGYVTFPMVNGVPSAQFNPITEQISIFNNIVTLAIEQLDPTVETYMSFGPTGTYIVPPTTNSPHVSAFTLDDNGATSFNGLDTPVIPNLTLEAISEATGRPSSAAVSAQIQYVTSNPNIIGNDAADIILSNDTASAVMYYTLDGSSPTNDGSNGIGPVTSGQTLVLDITSNITLTVRAFASGFAPSGFVAEPLLLTNDIGNQLTFGFANGYCSSKFSTAAGRYFFAPVTLSLLPGATMYSLQFNLTEVNLGAAPAVDLSAWQFQSLLMTPFTTNGNTFLGGIPPGIVTPNGTNFTVIPGTTIIDNLLEVAWIERPPYTNLYPTLSQDLTAYSEAHEIELFDTAGKVIVGAYGFPVPTKAAIGSQYRIQANLPSATTYASQTGAAEPVFIQAPTNGSTNVGAVNSIKTITVGTASYLVGNAYPFRWFNAGDFGDSNLLNVDVIEVFQSAVYGLNVPLTNSDFYDAMDSSNGKYNDFYDGSDADINSVISGDGYLMVDDVYVTLKRSLDTNLTWYVRNWSNGILTVAPFTNFVGSAIHSVSTGNGQIQASTNGPRYVAVAADQIQSAGNLSVQVPIRAWNANTNYPLRVLMLDVTLEPLDGSPPITNTISFSTGANLGAPTLTSSQGANDFSAAWLDSTVSGVSGTNIIGSVSVTLPANVTSNSAYRVHFGHFSASPNGLALFKTTAQDGLITVGNRSASSWNDGIPDSWRLLWFGTVSNALSAANADPDGDGASNWQEYVAGTNPNDSTSVFQFLPGASFALPNFTLQWPSVINKHYTVQSSASLNPNTWTTLATNIAGTGQTMQWIDTNAGAKSRFYRALVQ
jgi:hypothetical protein